MKAREERASRLFFFFNDTATTEISTLSLHDALPISSGPVFFAKTAVSSQVVWLFRPRSEEHTSELQSPMYLVCRLLLEKKNNKKRNQAPIVTPPTSAPHSYQTTYFAVLCHEVMSFSLPRPRGCLAFIFFFFFLMIGRPPRFTFFPYTALFR